jgi:hypothetical protein
MPRTTWRINSSQGGRDNQELIGCKLKQTDTGFDFTDADNDVLATTTDTTPPFTFDPFGFDSLTWTIQVTTVTGGQSNNEAQGTWSNNDPTIQGDEDGTWVGQAGGGADEDTDEAARGATL